MNNQDIKKATQILKRKTTALFTYKEFNSYKETIIAAMEEYADYKLGTEYIRRPTSVGEEKWKAMYLELQKEYDLLKEKK